MIWDKTHKWNWFWLDFCRACPVWAEKWDFCVRGCFRAYQFVFWLCYNMLSLFQMVSSLGIISKKSKTLSKAIYTTCQPLKHPKIQKHQVPAQTGHHLQNHFQNKFGSCVLPWITSNTFHTIHLNCPGPYFATVTSFAHFTIFILKLYRLSSTRSFRSFQSKLSIWKGQGNIKQAQKSFRPHS